MSNKRTFSPHFMSNSLGSDYGTFVCDMCNSKFHHSPSTIYVGEDTINECVCGNCTNNIIFSDYGSKPFE